MILFVFREFEFVYCAHLYYLYHYIQNFLDKYVYNIMNTSIKIHILRSSAYGEKIPRRCLKDLSNCINLSDAYLLKTCGINKIIFHRILRVLELVVPKTLRSNGIPFTLKVLLTVTFLHNGLHQKSVGKCLGLKISQKSVSRIVCNIVEGFNNVLNNWVVFPFNIMQRKKIKDGFYKKYHFPETIGCISGTHIGIICPRDDEEAFYNKRGQYSVHTQIICDSDLKIIAICSRFGGAANNTYIWNKMKIRPFIEDLYKQGENSWLIGNNNYPQRPWLMTPLSHETCSLPHSQYNHFHTRTKTCVEECIAILKGQWQCLYKRPLHYNPLRAAKIINACAVLHNLCLNAGLPKPKPYISTEEPELNEVAECQDDSINDLYIGLEVRRQLVERIYYNNI